mmetsp:Transcript_57944/g.92056  ORF Transcript_57944/g.92056 Transcript_57944/m.92056 type:complete len:206 (+) Transcript_57944:465-1082(+)
MEAWYKSDLCLCTTCRLILRKHSAFTTCFRYHTTLGMLCTDMLSASSGSMGGSACRISLGTCNSLVLVRCPNTIYRSLFHRWNTSLHSRICPYKPGSPCNVKHLIDSKFFKPCTAPDFNESSLPKCNRKLRRFDGKWLNNDFQVNDDSNDMSMITLSRSTTSSSLLLSAMLFFSPLLCRWCSAFVLSFSTLAFCSSYKSANFFMD